MVTRSVVAKRVEYSSQFYVWIQGQYDAIDRPFSNPYRKLSSNMYTSPAVLLYLPHDLGDLHFYKVSNGINRAKYLIL